MFSRETWLIAIGIWLIIAMLLALAGDRHEAPKQHNSSTGTR